MVRTEKYTRIHTLNTHTMSYVLKIHRDAAGQMRFIT